MVVVVVVGGSGIASVVVVVVVAGDGIVELFPNTSSSVSILSSSI